MKFVLGLALAWALVGWACSERAQGERPGPTATGAVAAVASAPAGATVAATPRGSGCGAAAFPADVSPGKTVERQLESGRRQRSYRLHVPASAKPGVALPAVVNFHGLGSNAIEQELYSGLLPLSEREGFVLVTPEGSGNPRSWASFALSPTGVDDVQFTRDLLDRLAADLCVDAGRVYATGMSNGAFMSSRLACVLSDRIAAIAPVAGVYFPAERCGRRVPVLAFHGTADGVVPFEPGNVLGVLSYDGVRKGMEKWAAHNGCDAGPTAERLTEHVVRDAHAGCKDGSAVALVMVEGGGHTWPGAIDVPSLGTTTHEISAAELAWAFFKEQRLAR